jgi:hypothetical protein
MCGCYFLYPILWQLFTFFVFYICVVCICVKIARVFTFVFLFLIINRNAISKTNSLEIIGTRKDLYIMLQPPAQLFNHLRTFIKCIYAFTMAIVLRLLSKSLTSRLFAYTCILAGLEAGLVTHINLKLRAGEINQDGRVALSTSRGVKFSTALILSAGSQRHLTDWVRNPIMAAVKITPQLTRSRALNK